MITQDELKELFTYDPETGIFTEIISNKPISRKNKNGYIFFKVKKDEYYLGHRLAWLYMTGSFPKGDLDHKDTNRLNNKWINLRECTNSQNQFNTTFRKHNKLKVKGVSMHNNKFRADIMIKRKRFRLGCFDTLEEAKQAYIQKATECHQEFIHKSLAGT